MPQACHRNLNARRATLPPTLIIATREPVAGYDLGGRVLRRFFCDSRTARRLNHATQAGQVLDSPKAYRNRRLSRLSAYVRDQRPLVLRRSRAQVPQVRRADRQAEYRQEAGQVATEADKAACFCGLRNVYAHGLAPSNRTCGANRLSHACQRRNNSTSVRCRQRTCARRNLSRWRGHEAWTHGAGCCQHLQPETAEFARWRGWLTFFLNRGVRAEQDAFLGETG
jgi:hypothetical protein